MPTGHDSNHTLANLFLSMAELLKKHEENPYRIRAYQRAADTIANLGSPVEELVRTGNLRSLSGIGKDLAAKIQEYVETGTIRTYEELKAPLPPAIRQWSTLPGLSDPLVHDLYYRLGIRTLDDLETMARSHMLRTRPGVGVTADELLAAIQRLRDKQFQGNL
ncbi:MAG: histidinol-phosphatase [Nitrospira sp.]|nr:histidinol-phosphatase [Nitrospira sp.]MDE0403830.1 histidinol-phosphatase [Nitrospira sp.]MDE0487205.1 histidinol-phosphatase [Nitrospira sp.]